MATAEKIVDVKGGGKSLSTQEIQARLATYRREIREYLNSLEANVESYKFSVEKEGEGVVIDVAIRAAVHPKNRAGISK